MKWIFSLLLSGYAFASLAQNPYKFFHLSLDKGLSDGRVTDIIQDKYGFMWFATPNGLNRYDAYSIKTFYADGKNGLPSNIIISLYSSTGGDLWIGTAAGVVRFDFAREQFFNFDTTNKEAAEVNSLAINDFEEDKAGNIYAASVKGIYRYSYKNKLWKNINDLSQPQGKLRRIRRLNFVSGDLLYASTSGNIPIFEYNISTNRYDSISLKIDGQCCPNMYGIEKVNEEELLGGLLSNGMVNINLKTKTYDYIPGVLSKNENITYNTVYDILKDTRNRIWIASFYFGLTEYLPTKKKIVPVESDPYNPYGFEGKSALCVYEDLQLNIWIGTSGKGVYRFNPDNDAVTFFHGNDFVPGALQAGRVISLVRVDSNVLMVGTEKGPSFYNYKTREHTNFKGISNTGVNGPLEYPQSGLADKDGRILWMGSNRLGLMRYDLNNRTFKCFSRVTKPYPLPDDGISDLLQLPDGNIFLIGFGNPGIFNTKTFQYFSIRNDSVNPVFKLNEIADISYDSNHNIWLATTGGKLYEYTPGLNILTDRTVLLSGFVDLKSIYTIRWSNDTLFLATNAGLILLKDKINKRIFKLNYPDNALNEIRGVLPDGEYIWFCNNRILGRIHIPTNKIIFIGEKDGFANVQLFSHTLSHSPKGTVLIGSNRGYYEIDGNRLKNSTSSASAYLTSFRLYDKQIETEEAISGLRSIKLKHDQNFFSFDMSAFDYAEADNIEYAYKLENFDHDWQYTGKKRSGSYTNVPGGNYILKLKSKNTSGIWNEQGQNIKIFISKPFWKTWWFYLLSSLVLLFAGFLWYKKRVKRIENEARLRSNYEIKLNELENSALRTQMNPHFIFNSLNTINSFINRNDGIKANQYISKFSKLIRLILDHSREKKITIQDELDVLDLYVQIERIRFENKFEYQLSVAPDIDTTSVDIPPLIIQPFIENAVLHGLLPLENNGILKLSIEKKDNILLCIVEDNGVGRKKSNEEKKFSPGKGKSHGLDITIKRIEMFNRENKLDASVRVIDLIDEQGYPAGTKVMIPVAWSETF